MKAFIIYLKEVQATIDAALECKQSARQHSIDAWMLEGHTPSRADDFLKQNNIKPYSPGPKIYDIKWNKPGVRGCFVSHYHAWQKCVALGHPIIVLEHDVTIVNEMPDVEYTDVLHLGHNKNGVEEYQDQTPFVESNAYTNKGVGMMEGAFAYAIKPHAADKLIQGVHSRGACAADWHICETFVDIKILRPRIAMVDMQQSLTQNRNFYL